MSDPLLDQNSLFDDLPDDKSVTEPKETKPSEPQINEEADWSGDFEQLEELIGTEAAWKIAQVYAGSTIYIPKSILTNKNYYDIRKAYKNGSSYRELSLKYGYTESHIRNIIHQKKEKP